MKSIGTIGLPLIAALLVSGCAEVVRKQTAAVPQVSDPLADAAALLAAAEMAETPAQRQPLLARLNAMQVIAAQDAADDPLAAWRAEAGGTSAAIYRGRTLGPAYRRARLAPGASVTIEQIFYAGQRAEIAAEATPHQALGNQPVAIAISNPRREEVCGETLTPRASCRWLPLFTERFSIALENRSSAPASVYLVFR